MDAAAMTQPMTNLDKLAERLSPSLRRELLTLSAHPADKPIGWCVKHGYRLERLGLAKRTLLSDRTQLTTDGLAVQQALRSHSKDQPNG